jgi:PleD family two-component response regulator
MRDEVMPHEANVNILLVDDQRENLLALEVMLDSLGQNLVKAYSGEEALRHLLERDFAVILLDAQMPEMDGFEIVKLIREKPASQHTPIILIADCNQDDIDIERAYSLGIVDYLKKPIAPSILRTKVGVFVSLFKKIEQSKQQAAQLEADNKELQREIAKRQQAEEAVRQSEERYRLLLESIPDAIEEENARRN